MSHNPVIRYDKFDISKLVIPKPEDNERTPSQKMSYPRFDGNNQLKIQTPELILSSGGTPLIGKFIPDERAQANGFKLPIDPTQPKLVEFGNKMYELDNMLSNDEFKEKMFGPKHAKYYYQPIIRESIINDDDDDDTSKKPKIKRPNYMKTRIDLDFNTGKIKTQVIQKNIDGTREIVPVETISEFVKYARYKSKVRLVILATKFYVTKNADPKTGKYTYGLIFKILFIEVEPPSTTLTTNNINAFIDDDDDDIKDVKDKLVKVNLKEDNNSDDEIEIKKINSDDVKSKKIKKEDSDSESESEKSE